MVETEYAVSKFTMATHKLHFTSARLEKLSLPETGSTDYYKDTETRGLELIITSGGAKTFYST